MCITRCGNEYTECGWYDQEVCTEREAVFLPVQWQLCGYVDDPMHVPDGERTWLGARLRVSEDAVAGEDTEVWEDEDYQLWGNTNYVQEEEYMHVVEVDVS